jgi:hypothetical protein
LGEVIKMRRYLLDIRYDMESVEGGGDKVAGKGLVIWDVIDLNKDGT